MCRQAHIIRVANIIRRSHHHLPKANIIQKTHLCLGRQKCVFCWRRWRDLNSRADCSTYTLSRGASSPLEYISKADGEQPAIILYQEVRRLSRLFSKKTRFIYRKILQIGLSSVLGALLFFSVFLWRFADFALKEL